MTSIVIPFIVVFVARPAKRNSMVNSVSPTGRKARRLVVMSMVLTLVLATSGVAHAAYALIATGRTWSIRAYVVCTA